MVQNQHCSINVTCCHVLAVTVGYYHVLVVHGQQAWQMWLTTTFKKFSNKYMNRSSSVLVTYNHQKIVHIQQCAMWLTTTLTEVTYYHHQCHSYIQSWEKYAVFWIWAVDWIWQWGIVFGKIGGKRKLDMAALWIVILNLMGTCLWERLKYQPNPFQCVISGKMARTAHSLAADSQWEEPKICGPIRSQDWSAGFPIAVTKTISNFAHHFFPCFNWITCAGHCGWHCGFRFREYKFIWQNCDLCQWANVGSLESWHL